MAYLRNNIVNLLNLHYAIHAIAMNGGGVFLAVYLLKAGVATPAILLSLALIVALRFILRPFVLLFAKRFGIKPAVIFGTIAASLQYPCLALVHGIDGALLALIATAAIGDTFYWTSYHAYFASLGDAEHRGHQVSAREALAALVGIVAPILGGLALTTFGPQFAFGAVAVIQILAAAPLFGTPNIAVKQSASGAFKMTTAGLLQFADGWIAAGYVFVWQISLFLSLGENFTAFGGAMAIAALAGAVLGMLLGRQIDAGHGGKAVWLSFAALAATILMRAAIFSPATAVAANAMGALVGCLYASTMMSAIYNQAKRSPCVLRFSLVTEGAWDAGCAAGCLTAAALIALDVPLGFAILLSLAGATAQLMLMRRYYRETAPST